MDWKKIPDTQWLDNEHQIIECVKYLKTSKERCFDIESSGLDFIKDYPIMFSLSDGIERFGAMADVMTHPAMKELLENFDSIVGSNIKIDKHWAMNIGVNLAGDKGLLIDTVVLDWLISENREGHHGLKEISWDYCGIKMREFKEVFPMKRATKLTVADTAKDAILRKISTPEGFDEAKQYAGLDAYANMQAYFYLKQQLQEVDCFEPTRNKDGTVSRWTLWDHALAIEVPFTRCLWNIERRGFPVSIGYFKQLETVAKKKLQILEQELTKAVGYELNPRSPQQLREFFFVKSGKKPTKVTEGGKSGTTSASVDIDVIKGFAEEGDVVAKLLVDHRQLSKLYSTYIKGLQEYVSLDGKIHTTIRHTGTKTGRISSSDPNLTNISKPIADIKIRAGFIAEPGEILIDADFAQLELVLMAHKSGDENMIKAICEGKDLHCFAIGIAFGYSYEKAMAAKAAKKKGLVLTDEQKLLVEFRDAVKAVSYGLLYGIGEDLLGENLTKQFRESNPEARNKKCPICDTIYPLDWEFCEHVDFVPIDNKWIDRRNFKSKYKLANYLKEKKAQRKLLENYIIGDNQKVKLIEVLRTVSPVEAKGYMDSWFNAFPGVREHINYQQEYVSQFKHVQSFLGRFRRLPEIDSVVYKDVLAAQRKSTNIIQGDAADIVKVVMLAIEEDEELRNLGYRMLIQVHDQITGTCPDQPEIVEKVIKRKQHLMENAFNERCFKLKVPLVAEVKAAYSWDESH